MKDIALLKKKPLPDFLCIGATKSGTTWLYKNLQRHSQVWVTPLKEINYFGHQKRPFRINMVIYRRHFFQMLKSLFELDRSFPRNIPWFAHYFLRRRNDNWYVALFRPRPGQIAGEVTPAYAVLGVPSIRTIRALNPHLKVIYLMRNPIERTWSGAIHMLARDKKRPVDKVRDEEFFRHFENPGVLLRNNYLFALKNWEEIFGREQIFTAFFEELYENPEFLLKRLYRFLGISDSNSFFTNTMYEKVNAAGNYKSQIPMRFQVYLARQQLPHLEELSKRFTGPPKAWLRNAKDILKS